MRHGGGKDSYGPVLLMKTTYSTWNGQIISKEEQCWKKSEARKISSKRLVLGGLETGQESPIEEMPFKLIPEGQGVPPENLERKVAGWGDSKSKDAERVDTGMSNKQRQTLRVQSRELSSESQHQ